jgi:hypothetical protein
MKSSFFIHAVAGAALMVLLPGCEKPPQNTEALANAQRKISELEAQLAKVKSDVQQQAQQPPPTILGDYIATGDGVKGGKLTISKQGGSIQISGSWDHSSAFVDANSHGGIPPQEIRFIDSAFDKAKLKGQYFWKAYQHSGITEEAANLVIEKDSVKIISPSIPEAVMLFKKTW